MSIRNGHARWAFNVRNWSPTLEELKIATQLIQHEEKTRLSKFVFVEDFKASLIGRLLIHQFVKQASNADYDKIIFGRDVKGKPFLKEIIGETNCMKDRIDFNVSHQGSYAVLAGCVNKNEANKTRIGVDTMKIEYTGGKPLDEFFRLMTRNFSTDEWNYIKSFNSNYMKLEAFMRNWCLKESYVKNVGTGIAVDLKKISFAINTTDLHDNKVVTDTKLCVNDTAMEDWLFEESLIDKEHCVAVALHNVSDRTNYAPLNFENISFDNLIKDWKSIVDIDENYCQDVLKKETKH